MSLLVATPVRAAELATAQVSLGYSDFRVRLARLMPDYKMLGGEATFSLDVVRARNRMVGLVLARPEFADVTHVLFVDDDNWPEDVRIVPEMLALDRPILAAPYTNKKEPMRWVHRMDGTSVAGVGFGFTMTSRALLEHLAKDAHWYTDLPHTLRVPNLFGQLYETVGEYETLLSEDFSFCKRAREAGFSIELHPGIVHHAGGHVWNAHQMPGGVI